MTGKSSIVVSGPPAVGKTTLARALAAEFEMKYVSGGDVLKKMASDMGYDSAGDDWWDTQEGMRFLQERESNHNFDRKLDEQLLKMFHDGGIVVTSYTLPWLAEKSAGGIRIWLDASHTSSSKRMQSRDSLPAQQAYEITRKRYDKNKKLYKEIYGFDFGEDADVFDYMIHTDDLTAEQVVKAAKKAILDGAAGTQRRR